MVKRKLMDLELKKKRIERPTTPINPARCWLMDAPSCSAVWFLRLFLSLFLDRFWRDEREKKRVRVGSYQRKNTFSRTFLIDMHTVVAED